MLKLFLFVFLTAFTHSLWASDRLPLECTLKSPNNEPISFSTKGTPQVVAFDFCILQMKVILNNFMYPVKSKVGEKGTIEFKNHKAITCNYHFKTQLSKKGPLSKEYYAIVSKSKNTFEDKIIELSNKYNKELMDSVVITCKH